MGTSTLIKQLKEAGQDFELYPTTREMIRCIWEHRRESPYCPKRGNNFGSVLDIGCGTCNFKRYVDEFNEPFIKVSDRGDRYEYKDTSKCTTIYQYYVMEKSRILLDQLDAETIVLGTDFHSNTLIDKPVDTIFCNPPYSEYEDWTARIIRESVCASIYLIIPQRWKNSEKIKLALETVKTPYNRYSNTFNDKDKVKVIGSFDFMDAERAARAKVDIVFIDKSSNSKDSGFDAFFDEIFGMEDKKGVNRFKEEREKINTEIATGKNKIEILCNGYAAAQQQLFEHFKAITGLDADILDTIGIQKDKVKEALKCKIEGLKNIYWDAAFDSLDEITSRLTSTSRRKMLERFSGLKQVDFTAENVYALIVWVIKNSNQYFTSQMIDFFYGLSSADNVRSYKSNQRVFDNDDWGYRNRKHDRYTLDYRIVCTQYALPGNGSNWHYDRGLEREMRDKISDICTVANNLGFTPGRIQFPIEYGKKGFVYMKDYEMLLFEFKCYLNNNVHIKLNKEFIKALNVAVARELGWIHSRADIAREFTPEMAEGAEIYFDRTLKIDLASVPLMLGNAAAEN